MYVVFKLSSWTGGCGHNQAACYEKFFFSTYVSILAKTLRSFKSIQSLTNEATRLHLQVLLFFLIHPVQKRVESYWDYLCVWEDLGRLDKKEINK